jgi:enamine deaminase RidA (YjgF/YER057c/UK114 family)
MVTGEGSRPASAEQRLIELGIKLRVPPGLFGTYVEAVQTGNLLFLSGMLPTEGHGAKLIGASARSSMWKRRAKRLTSRRSMSSLSRGSIWDRSTKWHGSSGSACRWPLREMSAISLKSLTPLRSCCKTCSDKIKSPCRLVHAFASLPLGTSVELEIIFEVAG